MTSAQQSSSRGPILGAVSGLVLLGAVVAFAVGLPEVQGSESDPADAVHSGEITLPETLPGDLVSLSSPDVPAQYADSIGGGVDAIQATLTSGGEGLSDLYDGPAALNLYLRTDGTSLATLVVASTDSGLFVPDGIPPLDPSLLGASRAQVVLTEVGDGLCSIQYAAAVPEGQDADPAEVPSNTICQLESDGLTYQLSGAALTGDDAMTALDAAAAFVGGDEDAVPSYDDMSPFPDPDDPAAGGATTPGTEGPTAGSAPTDAPTS